MAMNWEWALSLSGTYGTMKTHFDLIIFRTLRNGIDRLMIEKVTVNYDLDGMNHGIIAHKVMSHADKGREILVLESGVINRHLSRITGAGLHRLATFNDDEWMRFSLNVSSVTDLKAHNFTEHVRRTWPARTTQTDT